MSTDVHASRVVTPPTATDMRRPARMAGLWYLGLAVSGGLGFGLIRPKLHAVSDPAATLANLVGRADLARVAVAVELAIVVTQAVTAVMFYRLLRRTDPVAAWSAATFGTVNAVIITVSAMLMAAAAQVAQDPTLAPGGDAEATVQLLFQLSSNAWSIGGVFFGLWLVPIGFVALRTKLLPQFVGWLLYAGGAGYLLAAFLDNGLVDPPGALISALTIPATIAEVATIGFLIWGRAGNPIES